MLRMLWIGILVCVALLAGCSDDGGGGVVADNNAADNNAADNNAVNNTVNEAATGRYTRQTLDGDAAGPAFVSVADVNGDGRQDIVLSSFGQIEGLELPTGSVTIYEQGDGVLDWTAKPLLAPEDGLYWPNDVELHDIDGDGDLDAMVGFGFLVCAVIPTAGDCGGLIWFEQDGDEWIAHPIIPQGAELFYHVGKIADIDGDGVEDVLSVGEYRAALADDRAEVVWFKGTTGPERFEQTPRVIGPGLGSLPTLYDIDGDGDLDVLSAEFFAGLDASFAWYEQTAAPSTDNPAGQWQRHVIDDAHGPSIQFSLVPDLLGDGELKALGANHTNTSKSPADPWPSTVVLYDIPADPTAAWSGRPIAEHIVSEPGSPAAPQAAPGIFGWGDADGDGDVDVIVSGDGDPKVYLLEQRSGGEFVTMVFDEDIAQAGGMKIVDLDGDGVSEIIVTAYEDNALYLYTQTEDGPHPLREAGPGGDLPVEDDEVLIEVTYTGNAQGNLIGGLFETFPPTGPPSSFTQQPSPTFPATLSLTDVAPGEYTALVVLDVEPFNPASPGPEDLQATVEITVPLSAAPVRVTLQDNGDANNNPQNPTPADVVVNLNYDGAERGNVVVAAFDSLPPAGPPAGFTIVDASGGFPAQGTLSMVGGGTRQVLAFLDLPPTNIMAPGPEDPVVQSEPFLVNGATVELSLTLQGPDGGDPVDPPAGGELFVGDADPFGAGPLGVTLRTLPAGRAGLPVPVDVYVPEVESGTFGVLLFMHGFVLNKDLYNALLESIAAHGFVVVAPTMYDTGGLPFGTPSMAEESALALELRQWFDDNLAAEAGVAVDLDRVGIAGHSRGGKVAWTLMLDNPELFAAIAGYDPVDGTGGGPGMMGPDMRITERSFDYSHPSLVIGTGLGAEGFFVCAPLGDNHVQFYESTPSPSWHIIATNHGHNDLLDDDCGFQCGVCASGDNKALTRNLLSGTFVSFFRGALLDVSDDLDRLSDPQAFPDTALTIESR